jgi:hypothetical protein
MIFPVTTGMLVAQLRLQISGLVEAVNLVYLLAGGTCWTHDVLEHSGTITDRVFPGTVIPCPYLQQGSRVLVYLERPDSEPFLPPVPVPLGLSSLDIAQAAGGWGSHSLPSTLLTQQSSSLEAGEHSIPTPICLQLRTLLMTTSDLAWWGIPTVMDQVHPPRLPTVPAPLLTILRCLVASAQL